MHPLTHDQILTIIAAYNNNPQHLVAILLDIQAASGRNYVSKKWAELVSEKLKIPLSQVFEALTFYSMLSTEPRGQYLIEICKSPPCYFSGGEDVKNWFEEAAQISVGQTSADGKISLEYTSCIGACDTGPSVKIGDRVFGNLDRDKVFEIVKCCREGNLDTFNPEKER